ncbi:MAG: hypothetical protein ACLFRQ_01870 [Desulfonatronovibrio sp.]
MDSRELIKDTIEFNNPQRIPRDLWTLPWAENKYPETIKKINEQYPPDIVRCPGYYRQELPIEGYRYKKGEFIDEWGCRFVNLHEGIHGEVKNPILDEWDKLNQIHIPEERLTLNKEKINLAEQIQGKISGDKQVLDLKDPDIELTLGQVALLEEEISYLLEEIKAKRKIFVEKRRRKYLEKTD